MNAALAVFSAGFLSATLLPGGSEALLYYQINQGSHVAVLLLAATAGNTLGSFTNYIIGRWAVHLLHNRFLGFNRKQLRKGKVYFRKYGAIALLGSFLPVIGDPITAVAGMMKYPVGLFFLFVTISKTVRYIVVIAAALYY